MRRLPVRVRQGERARVVALVLAFEALVVTGSGAGEPRAAAPPPAPPRFTDGASEILRRRCVRCHGGRDAGGDLRLDSFTAVMRGGEQGPALVEGDPDASLLYLKIRRIDRPPMPPRVPLRRTEREVIRAWIAAGALP